METIKFQIIPDTNTVKIIKNKYKIQIDAELPLVKKDVNLIIPSEVEIDGIIYTVTIIGESAFRDLNYDYIYLTIPNSIRIIERNAFSNCKFEKITIPKSVKEIQKYAFSYNSELNTLIIEGNPVMDSDSFDNCYKMRNLIYKSEIPPTIRGKYFLEIQNEVILFVKDEFIPNYENNRSFKHHNIISLSAYDSLKPYMEINIFKFLYNKIIKEVKVNKENNIIDFIFEDNNKLQMWHQDNYADVYIEDICGDIIDIVNSPILQFEETIQGVELPDDEHQTNTWYKIGTIKGCITVRWNGQSNGYYSEDIDIKYNDIDIKLNEYYCNIEELELIRIKK